MGRVAYLHLMDIRVILELDINMIIASMKTR